MRGAGGYALTFAVEQLLGAVDWVMDPANNQIIYHETPKDTCVSYNSTDCSGYSNLWYSNTGKFYSSPDCIAEVGAAGWWGNTVTTKFSETQVNCVGSSSGTVLASFTLRANSNYNPAVTQKSLPIDPTVAQKVIDNANANNTDAQKVTMAAAGDIANDAETNPVTAQPIIEQLEANASTSSTGSPNDPEDEESDQDKIDKVLENTTARPATKGRARQYDKDGGFSQANADFDSMKLNNIRNIPDGRVGKMNNGTMVNVRSVSSGKEPTLEIQIPKKPIKIRYN